MDPLHERQLSSRAAGPSHAPEGPQSRAETVDESQYGGLSFVSVCLKGKRYSLHNHKATPFVELANDNLCCSICWQELLQASRST